ncbi:putative tyrosinase [Apodospora peruviana]|uniref:Tyrosinase n=1 Tax=Apodospora peruviana TaxID=516989 RepID=A0AAE0LYH8_9PEZI|nr:putative tyrosinase [Apodospora peruviana]
MATIIVSCRGRPGRAHGHRRALNRLRVLSATAVPTLPTQPRYLGRPRESSGCANPARRREWRTLGTTEKAEYISAVKCFHDLPSVIQKRIGEMTHYAAPFLPWHRYFIHDPTQSPIWDAESGFGGDGTSGGDFSIRWGTCIADGPFSDYEVHWYNRTSRPHCLSRGFGRQSSYPPRFSGDAFSPDAMAKTFAKERYIDFSMQIEIGPHNSIPHDADPNFFLHHAQVDRLWWTWQTKASQRMFEYNGPKEGESKEEASLDDLLPMHGLGPDLAVREMMSTRDGMLCYVYE